MIVCIQLSSLAQPALPLTLKNYIYLWFYLFKAQARIPPGLIKEGTFLLLVGVVGRGPWIMGSGAPRAGL